MSLPSIEKGQNFENLYNSLKAEYDQALLDNDEICKEYESTIELLKNTLDKTTAEKEKLQNKNKEKLEDIQDLTKLNDKLKEDIKRIREEKKLKESKIVFLENDNEHYQNKIRQFEAIIDDLNIQLESTLEENITLQTEFEIYKQSTSEELMRKEEELQDCKSDIINKEKIIQQLNSKKIMKKIEEKMKLTKESLKKYQRKFSETSLDKEIEKNKKDLLIDTSMLKSNIFKSTNVNLNCYNKTEVKNKNDNWENEALITPLLNHKAVIPGKFQEIYRKSIKNVIEINTPQKFSEKIEINDSRENENNIDNIDLIKKNSHFKLDSQESSSTKPKNNDNNNEKENDDENLIKDDENEQDGSSSCFSYEQKIFEYLVICNEKNFSINSVKNLITDKLMKNKKLKENMQKLLILTQQRKNNLLKRRKNIKERLSKVGYNIRD